MIVVYVLAGLLIVGGFLAIGRQKLANENGHGPVDLGLGPHAKANVHGQHSRNF
jgi:hypothetical protein